MLCIPSFSKHIPWEFPWIFSHLECCVLKTLCNLAPFTFHFCLFCWIPLFVVIQRLQWKIISFAYIFTGKGLILEVWQGQANQTLILVLRLMPMFPLSYLKIYHKFHRQGKNIIFYVSQVCMTEWKFTLLLYVHKPLKIVKVIPI